MYIKDSQETTTWGAVSAGLDKSSDEFIMQVPIAIHNEAGDKIGYVHTKDWITEKHVSGDLNTDMEALSKTRKAILSGKVNGIITGNNAGMFFRTIGNQLVAVSKAMPDPKLELVVSKNGLPYTNRNTTSNKTPINKLKDGLLYAIVPYGDKHVALPLMVGNINENHARALIKAITIYATNDTKNPFREYVLKTLKLDITTPAGINEFLKIYVNDTSLNGNIVPGNTNAFRFHVSKGKIYFARGGTDITKAPYIAQSGDTNSMAFRELMNLISNNIRTLYYNVSLDKLDSGNIISLDADGNASESNYRDHIKDNSYSNILGFNVGTESDPEYTYTLQPAITFSIDSKEDTTKPSKEENKVVTKPVNVSTTDKEKPVKKALPSKLIKKINTDDDITSDALLSSNTKKALENNSKNVYSPKLGAKIQNGVVNYIIGRVIDKAFSSMDLADRAESKKLDITGELESIKNEYIKERDEALANVEELTKLLGDEEYNQEDIVSAIESNKYYAAMANTVIEEWKVMTRLAQEGIFKLNNATFDTLSEESIDTELEDNGESPERAFDSSQLTFDTLNKLSVKVKRLFGGIKKVNKYGEPLLNAFNQEMSMPFDEVYNTLQSLTTNLKPSYEVMKAKMLASKEKFPWITQVIDKLDAADELTRNSFVTGMSNHSRDMKFYMWARDKNGKFTLSEYDANANSVTQILLNTWANNIMYNINSEISKQMVIGDSVVIAGNPEVIDLVQAQFEKFRTNPSKVTTEELSQWLKSIGIELSTKSIEYIRNNMVASKNWNANFSSRSGIFNIINSNLGKLKNDNIDGSDFLKDSALKELARIEATFSNDVLPTSFRAGKKSVFSYGNNNLLVDSIRRLKEYNTLEDGTFTSDVLTELMSTSFTRESYWLKSMLVYDAEGKPLKGTDGKYRIDPNSSGYANLNHAVMSLEAIKEIKTKSRDNRELHKLSPAEVELVKIAMLQSVTSDLSGKNQRRIKVTFPTTSDKTTVMMLSTIAFDIKYNTDGTIDDNTLNRLYDIFVLPELYRITNYQANGKKLNVDAYNDGADKFLLFPEFNNIDGLFDEDGNISLEAYNDSFKSKFKDLINKYIEELVADKLSNWNTYGIGLSSKPGDEKPYTNAFLDAKFMDNITTKGVAKENAVKAAATDMVVQYLVSNVEAMKMFIGDPAQFWKAKPTDDIITATRKLYDNVGKRLAGDIAPGTTLAESEGNTYIQLFAEDVETPSKELDNRLFTYLSPEDLKAYKKMNSADAQEYTTWKEHLDVLFMLGKITQQDKDTITSIINRYVDKKSKNLPIEKEDRLTKDQIHMVLQPMKPVYVNTSVYEGDYDFRRRVYIKSSSFPLIPELTDGLEIDNLRVAMEELETSTNKGVRLAYASAAKIGAVSSKATIFKNGRFVKGLKFTEDNYLVLDRKGFRIQQEIPYDPNKQEIREVTQASKNLFLDVLDVNGFKLPNDNTEYSGKQLYNKFVEAHSKLYTTSKMLLLNRILNKDGKTINIPELRELLKEEALKRNYNISDRLLIDLDKDLEFLPYSAIESKYQAVLNAIVYNNIVKQKIHGKSFVLGSQVGFKQTEVISSAKGISGIIFTEEFDSEIKPMHIVNGELKPNQVILPWKFRDNYGNILDINNFTKVVNDRVVIDTTKLPKELLLGFGMRIPNQAQNSQAVFEIVGFLPESMQDLIIAPEEFTIQMGSDFDVDKLYTYTYNTWYNNKTKELSKISLSDSEIRELYYKRRDKDESVDRLLEALFGENATEAINYDYELFAAAIKMLEYQNELVDIHIASHMNPHPKVQEAISKPLDNWIIENVAAEVNKARISRESNRMFAPMSESYQTKKFMQATAGKAGVGIFSLDSMFNALAQTVNTLEFNSTDNKGNEILKPIAFGNVVSDFKLNRINTLDNKYTISKVISGYQSASVDNEKLQVLDKLNINSETFEVIKLLNQLGFGEEVLWFISQDIIFDYVNEVIRLKGTLGEFVKDAKILAFMNTLINKYGYTQEGIQLLVEFGEGSTLYNPSLDDMKSLVKYSKDSVPSNFKEAQAHILLKFMNLQSLAKDLSTLERGINLDSKGFGASLFDSIEKEESIIKSISSNNIKGASSLFGDVVINPKAEAISELESNGYVLLEYNNSNLNIYIKPTTIPGLALVHGLDVNNSLWREISPIASQRFQTISKRMAVLTTADTRSNKAEFNKEVWDGVRSFIFANSNWNDSLNNTSERREILLTDKESEVISNINGVDTKVKIKTSKSLGTILNEIKNTPLFRSNAFLRRLEVIPQTTNGTTIYTIQYRAGIKEGVNDTEIYTDFLGLLLNEVKITDNNNKEYTTTDLAQDLIEYSFITGGIQGATEFIKLIPPAYLHSIGMFKYVNDFFYEDSTLLPLTDLYAFNRFELEFIRNNPGLVKPKVNTSDEEFKSFKPIYDDSKRLQAFTIPFVDKNGNSNTGLIARYATLNEGNVVPVPFITIRNYNSPSGYDLYYFDGQSQYLYISTLGNKNISEYNSVGAGLFNSTYKPVIMPDIDKPITNIAAPTINSKSIFDSTTISIAYDNLLKHLDGNELQGKEGVKALLDLLAYSSSTDAVDSSIISIMSNNLHKLPDNIKIVFNLDEASDKEGMFVYDLNNNNINTLFFKDTLLGQLATKDGIDYALPIILHELYHAFTSRLITKFSKGEKIEDDNLRKILVSLESSRRQYKEHLSNKYPEEFKEFNIKYSKFTGGDKTITFSDREIAIFYPSVSLKEFTAQTTSAEDFMNELNMIYSDNSTLLSKVFDSLSKLLSYIFGIDNNTLFYKSLTESLELINPNLSNSNNFQERYDIEFQEETSGTSLSEMYRNRTIKNASADATIALAVDFTTAGEKLTKSSVNNQNKKYIPIDANNLEVTQERVNKIVSELNSVNAKTLNIAGNGIYTMKQYTQKQIDDFTYNLLKAVVESPNLKNKIESIRTGGQTGFDEAGAKAGKKLGIKTLVLAPKGFTFRNANNEDISDEQQFKDRFKINSQPVNTSNLQISEKENNKIPKATGLMKFSYGNNKRADVTSLTTLEAIKKGERTATTRYESDGNINYWKNLKVGDIIEWEGQNSEKVLVEVTKPLHKLRGSGKTAEQWSKLEGWSVDYFNSKVKPRLDEAWQMEFKPISNQTINTSNSIYKWARYSNNSYEVSSQGDKRFSALFAKLQPGADITIIKGFPDGTYSLETVKLKAPLTIEEIYQIYIKGYKTVSEGKGKPPKYDISKEESYNLYKNLWRVYLEQNPELEQDLREKAKGKVLTDKFASTDISQARALAEILNEKSTIVNKSTLQKRNVFTINPTKAIDKKASVKASVANKFIGYGEGIEGSSTESYRQQVLEQSKNNIEISTQKYTRQSVENDSNTMYLFTDNAERTSSPNSNSENVDKNTWYYKKYKSKTNKPIHFGSLNNPTSAVIRGLNNAYPISTMSAYGTNWTDNNFELFKHTIDDEINQIKKDLPKFSKLKIGNYRIGQGGLKAKLPLQHQNYLDNKLKEIGIDNTQSEPKIINKSSIVNSNNYSSNDVVFVSIVGKRGNEQVKKEQQDKTIKEALKAIEAGATLITDNISYIHYNSKTKQQRPITMSVEEFRKEDGLYNIGEKRLYENLKVKGYNYSEQTVDGEVLGVWTNNSTPNAVVEEKLSKPSVIESYTEFGTTYKFELVDGEIVKATYTQGYSSNELELSPKNWYKVYNRLKDTPKQEGVKPTTTSKKTSTTFTFSDGITVDTDFELNNQQAIALQKMADFFNKPNSVGLKDNSFILSGYAGTGKTSIIKYLVKYIREANRRKGKYQTIVFSSPTHRANMQLKKNTKETVITIHSLFGLSPDLDIENLDYNNLKFIAISDPKFEPEDILIVDESSMISAALFKIMEDLVESFGSTSTKIIFMGDKAQLGPVKDKKQSPVFDLVNKADLTKVERTKDSPLLDEITHIRNAKQDEKPYTYSSTQNANGNGVTFVTKRNQFLESMAKAFLSTEFKNDKLTYRALAFTKEEVKEINTSVRDAMFGNDAVNQYQKGELVMAYANRFKNMRTKEFMYMNGTDYIVTQSSNGVKEYNGIQYNGVNVTLQSEYYPDITVSTFVIITENNSITNLKALSSYLESLRLAAVRALGSSKGMLWKKYYDTLNIFLADNDIKEINPLTGELNVLIPKGIDYGYAHTIHKSQGGEYKQVFINDADISRSPDENMIPQLRYVAASRAKEHATIFYSNTISKEKITNFEEDSTTPDYRDFSMPLSDIPDIPDHILDNPDYDPNKIMNDYNSRIDNIDFDNDINTFNDINPSPEDSYHSDLLLKGYITRDDIERLKKICK